MLEIQLIALFVIACSVIIINGIICVKSCRTRKYKCVMLIPITDKTENIELIVRKLVYSFAENCPETEVVLVNFNADDEKIMIFEKLMESRCSYTIINSEKCSENICNIIESMVY